MQPISMERRDNQLTIRIPRRIRAELEAAALTEGRSVSDIINNALAARYPAPLSGKERQALRALEAAMRRSSAESKPKTGVPRKQRRDA
jgi:uncharacterized protein (DUF1778 family)